MNTQEKLADIDAQIRALQEEYLARLRPLQAARIRMEAVVASGLLPDMAANRRAAALAKLAAEMPDLVDWDGTDAPPVPVPTDAPPVPVPTDA